jgi:hypothetical protein
MGQVLTGNDDQLEVLLVAGPEAGERLTVPVGIASDYRLGVIYPVLVDPTDPSRARMVMDPYDSTEPRAWAALAAVVLGSLLLVSWVRRAAMLRRAQSGPWATAWVSPADGGIYGTHVAYGPVPGEVSATSRMPAGVALLDFPATVLVAGSLEPGSIFAVATVDGTVTTVRARAVLSHVPPAVRALAAWRALTFMTPPAELPADQHSEHVRAAPPTAQDIQVALGRVRRRARWQLAAAAVLAVVAVGVVLAGWASEEPRLVLWPAGMSGLIALTAVSIVTNANRAEGLVATGLWIRRPAAVLANSRRRRLSALYLPETAYLPEVALRAVFATPLSADADPVVEGGENLDPEDDELPEAWVIHDADAGYALVAPLEGSALLVAKRPRRVAARKALLAAVHIPAPPPRSRARRRTRRAFVVITGGIVVVAVTLAVLQNTWSDARRCPDPGSLAVPGRDIPLTSITLPVTTAGGYLTKRDIAFEAFDQAVFEEARLAENGAIEAVELREVDEAGRVTIRVDLFRFSSAEAARTYHKRATRRICQDNGHNTEPVPQIEGAYAMSNGMNDLYVLFVRGNLRVAVDEAASPVGTDSKARVLATAIAIDKQLTPDD